MRVVLGVLFAALATFSLYTPSDAQVPAFSVQRVSVAAGIDYSKASEVVGHNYGKEWELKPSLNAAYNLGNHVSLTGSAARGLKSKTNEYRVGFRLRLYRGAAE